MPTDAVTDTTENRQAPALRLVALLVILVAAFLLHFNLLQAPMQGEDFSLFFFDDAFHRPFTAIRALDRLPGAPLAAFSLGMCMWVGAGTILLARVSGLFLFVVSAVLVFHLLRLLLNNRASVVAPLAGSLLFIVSPAAPGVLGVSQGRPALMAVCFALAAALLYVHATRERATISWPPLALACIFLAMAFASHHGMIVLPAVLLLLDLSRLDAAGRPGRWPSVLAATVAGVVAAALGAVAYVSGGALPAPAPALAYSGCALAAIALAWLMDALPRSAPRHVLTGLAAAAIIGGGIASFAQGLHYVDPVMRLEQDLAEHDCPDARRLLALHYMQHAASDGAAPETRANLLRQAVALWPDEATEHDHPFRLRAGAALLALGETDEAAALLESVLDRAPFSEPGHEAAVALARTLDIREQARQVAALYAFVGREGPLPPEDALRHGLALMRLGDVERAAAAFDFAAARPEDSVEGMTMHQARTARNIIHSLRDKAREALLADPTAATGYVSSGEAALAAGNLLRAYYWLDLALTRDKEAERAWELMGLVLTQHDQAQQFIDQWGHIKQDAPEQWLRLARQAARTQLWDAALAYAYQADTGEAPLPEEVLALFAIEMQRLDAARQWLDRAAEAHPDAYSPWLFKADIALAQQQPEEARQLLDEARRRNAPETDIEARHARIQGAPAPAEDRPFEPVRSIIQ